MPGSIDTSNILDALIFVGVYLVFVNLGVNIGYHRFLAHKSFKMAPFFRYFVVLIGLPAGTPIQWAGNHRMHHAHVDSPRDPHSPFYGGFWHAHCGWYISSNSSLVSMLYAFAGPLRTLMDAFHRPRSNQQYNHLAKDISRDPFLNWISNPKVYTILVLAHLFLTCWLAIAFFSSFLGLGVFWFASVLAYNLGDSVDSIGHLFGSRPYKTNSMATDHWLTAFLTFGDGWHATHHRYPKNARHGCKKGQFDWTYYVLRALERVNLVSNLVIRIDDEEIESEILKSVETIHP